MTDRAPGVAAGDAPAAALRCRACGASRGAVFHRAPRVPVHSNLLLESRREALEHPTGALELTFCPDCGFIANQAYDPARSDYSLGYDGSQAFSPRFARFAEEVADLLDRRYDLRGKEVLEIGCGQGEFLELLCRRTGARGLGMDPAFDPSRPGRDPALPVRYRAERFDSSTAGIEADLIGCRHTLEHLPEVAGFLREVREAAQSREGTIVFFEVPDTLRILEEGAFWDIYYEHCSYFTAGSLARLFRSAGFRLLDLRKEYGGQYLMLEACLDGPRAGRSFPEEDDLPVLARAVERFAGTVFPRAVELWRGRAAEWKERRRRVVLWGSGSKAVGYLTTLGISEGIEEVVDINPHKWGKFIAGTGQEIVPPRSLAQKPPDLVVVMNPVYQDEIRNQIRELGLDPEIIAV